MLSQKEGKPKNELVLNEYKLEYETESTESQYFISDADAWNTLRKQLATTARGCAVLYIKENCELPIINNTVLAKREISIVGNLSALDRYPRILAKFKMIIKIIWEKS